MMSLAAFLLAPALVLVSAAGLHERTETRRVPMASGSTLDVRTANGSIQATSWDKEEVELVAEIREQEKGSVMISVHRDGSTLAIEAQLPNHRGASWGGSDGVSFTLKVPKRIVGLFTTSNGRIEVARLEGKQTLTTSNGRITAEDVKGDLAAHTSNASVTVNRLDGSLSGATSNGSISLDQVSGGIRFSTSNGSIQAGGLDGQGKGIDLMTSNGSIRLDLGQAKGEVDARTSHGKVHSEREGLEFIASGKDAARLKVPGSNQTINLRTSNGSITIR